MKEMQPDLYKILAEIEYQSSLNTYDNFWIANRDRINAQIDILSGSISDIDYKKWQTPKGRACTAALRLYIQKHNVNVKERMQDAYLSDSFPLKHSVKTIDFENFSYEFEGQWYRLERAAARQKNRAARFDLSGIDLSSIIIQDTIITNVNFEGAIFDNAVFERIVLDNTIMKSASLKYARICFMNCDNGGEFSKCDIKGASLTVVKLDNTSIDSGLKYQEVSYWYLLYTLFMIIFSGSDFEKVRRSKHNHTIFIDVDVTGLTLPANKEFRNYITWYQYVFANLANFKYLSISHKILFGASLVMTKAWTSFGALIFWGFLTNVCFASLYLMDHESLNGLKNDFISAFYFSVVTFSSLGFGDVTPISSVMKIIVMFEVLLGYVTLGTFVFLISQSVDDRF